MIDIIHAFKRLFWDKTTLSQTYRLMHIFAVNSSSTIFNDSRVSFKGFKNTAKQIFLLLNRHESDFNHAPTFMNFKQKKT